MNKALATQENLKKFLSDTTVMEKFRQVLPQHMSADRMARIAIAATSKTPKLNECTITSVMKCLIDLSALGLEPDGRHAHLIPYGKECTLIVDYKGLVALAYRSGDVKSIHADVVFEGDIFDYRLGKVQDHVQFDFRFDDQRPDSKGDVVAAYCIVQLKGGAEKHEVMTIGELEGIRSRSKAKSSGPWKTDTNEMYKKTVFRRASKWIPMSAEMREHYDRDFDTLEPVQVRQVRRSSLNAIVDDSPSQESNVEFDESKCRQMLAMATTVDEIREVGQTLVSNGADSAMVGALEQEYIEHVEA